MEKKRNKKIARRIRVHRKIRTKVFGTKETPRLAVFRSNKFMYAQLIDDETHATILGVSDNKVKKGAKVMRAENVGAALAKEAKAKGITKIVFDRGGFSYTGRVKALADAARKGGLIF